MARRAIERNIAFDETRQAYYVTLDYGKDEFEKRMKVVKKFETVKEARQCLIEFEYNKKRGSLAAPCKDTVESYITYWLDNIKELKCRKTTLYGYRNIVQNHIIPYLGDIEVQN